MRKCDRRGATTWPFVYYGNQVGAVLAVHAKTAFLPVDQVVEPMKERDPQDQVRVCWHHAEVDEKSERVHDDVDVHEFGAMDGFP